MRRKDRLVEAPQAMLWYHRIRIALGKRTAYAVEKVVEPNTFHVRDGCVSHNNKWIGYAQGDHLPQKRVRALAEGVCPESSTALDHPIWKVASFARTVSIIDFSERWLSQLAPNLQRLIFRFEVVSNRFVRRSVTARMLRQLRAHANLDALAAMSIFLREAAERRRFKQAMTIADSLYRTLFDCVASTDEALQIALPGVYNMLAHRVFPFARDRRYGWSFDGVDGVALFHVIERACCEAERTGISRTECVDLMIDLAHVNWRSELVSFPPPLRPLDRGEKYAPDEVSYQELIKEWKNLISDTPVRYRFQ